MAEFFHVELGLGKSSFECLVTLDSKFWLLIFVNVSFLLNKVTVFRFGGGLSQRDSFLCKLKITMSSVIGVMLLVLADVCLPSEVGFIYGRYKNINFIRWLVL